MPTANTQTIRAHVVPTSRTVRPEFLDQAPEFCLSTKLPPCSGYFADGDVVQLPDGSCAYTFEVCGAIGLYRDAVVTDYGDNERRRRTAPESTDGIAAPIQGLPLRDASGENLVGWLAAPSEPAAVGWIADRNQLTRAPIATLVTRDDDGVFRYSVDSARTGRAEPPAGTTIHATDGAAIAEAKRRWRAS